MAGFTESDADCFDVAIVGAGGAGGVLAARLAAAGCGLRVALLEQSPPRAVDPDAPDQRGLVLTLASVALLKQSALWPALESHATPVRGVHISRQHTFGTLAIDASRHGLEALAQVVQANRLHHALDAHLSACAAAGALTLLRPVEVTGFSAEQGYSELRYKKGEGASDGAGAGPKDSDFDRTGTLRARLVVAADGTESPLAGFADIPVRRHDYAQTALVGVIDARPAHQGVAVERFTLDGPLALLPLPEGRRVAVSVLPSARAAECLAAGKREGEAAFIARVTDVMGGRLRDVALKSALRPWPLKRVLRDSYGARGLALIGNAAHTIHPNGAQGLNLGLADVAELVARIEASLAADGGAAGCALGSAAFIADYRQARRRDQRAVVWGSHAVAEVSRQRGIFGAMAYHAGFGLLDCVPALQTRFVQRATGLGAPGRTNRVNGRT